MSRRGTLRWRSAVLEGFAVLVGILLAFGIDAAWDVQRQREETNAYLAAIRTELESNREQIRADIDTLEAWIEESLGFLESVAGPGATPTYQQTVDMVWLTNPRRPPPLAESALNDLLSSGGFPLIESVALRRALSEYQRALENDAIERTDIRDFFNQYQQPYHVTEGSFSAFPWENYAEVPRSSVTFPLPTEPFVANRTYANLLIVRMLSYSNLREEHRIVARRIDEVLRIMDDAP